MQYTNVISIDPSTTCTGICINGKMGCVASQALATKKNGDLNKWFSHASETATMVLFDIPAYSGSKDFSVEEIYKLDKYDKITDIVVTHILDNIKSSDNSICILEGFSYNSVAGRLIDLVTFSTLLRHKLKNLSFDILIVPPAKLKLASAQLTYDANDVGKKKSKLEWRNREGVAAGRFTKHEMYKAITENSELDDGWTKLVKNYQDEQLSSKSISKPLEDINDAYLLYQAFVKNLL